MTRRTIFRGLTTSLAIAMFSGCSTRTEPAIAPVAHEPMRVRAPIARTWGAVLDYTIEHHVAVTTSDREAGLVALTPVKVPGGGRYYERRFFGSADPHPLADCGKVDDNYVTPTFVGYVFHVLGDSAGSTVHVRAEYSSAMNVPSMAKAPCTTTSDIEVVMETDIKRRVEARR